MSGSMEGSGVGASMSGFMLSLWPKVGVFVHSWGFSWIHEWQLARTFFHSCLGHCRLPLMGAKSSARRPEMNHHNGAQSRKLSQRSNESLSWTRHSNRTEVRCLYWNVKTRNQYLTASAGSLLKLFKKRIVPN